MSAIINLLQLVAFLVWASLSASISSKHLFNLTVLEHPLLFHPLKISVKFSKEVGEVGDKNEGLQMRLGYLSMEPQLYKQLAQSTMARQAIVEIDRLPFSVDNKNISTNTRTEQLEFPCWDIALPGHYRIGVTDVGRGNEFTSLWLHIPLPSGTSAPASVPSMRLPAFASNALFPGCKNDFPLHWTLSAAGCDPQRLYATMDFRIRVFASSQQGRGDQTTVYLEEYSLDEGMSDENKGNARGEKEGLLKISCAQFDIVYDQFCFELISIARNTRHFQLWDRKCVRAEPISATPSGNAASGQEDWVWAEWTEWSKCECGPRTAGRGTKPTAKTTNGTRKRSRHCQHQQQNRDWADRTTVSSERRAEASDSNSSRGLKCQSDWDGQIVQREKCQTECTAERFYQSAIEFPINLKRGDCQCGCELTGSEGIFYANLCESKTRQRWIIARGGVPFRLRMRLILTPSNAVRSFAEGHQPRQRHDHQHHRNVRLLRDEQEIGEEIIWTNWDSKNHSAIVTLVEDISERAIFEIYGEIKREEDGQFGVLIDYQTSPISGQRANYISRKSTTNIRWIAEQYFNFLLPLCATSGQLIFCTTFLALCSLLIALSLLILPPVLLIWLSKKYKYRRRRQQFSQIQHVFMRRADGLSSHHCPHSFSSTFSHKHCPSNSNNPAAANDNDNMVCSDNTETTELSAGSNLRQAKENAVMGSRTVGHRSVGIQLSRQSSPKTRLMSGTAIGEQRRTSDQKENNKNSNSNNDYNNGQREHLDTTGFSNCSLESGTEFFWNDDDGNFFAEELQLGTGFSCRMLTSPSGESLSAELMTEVGTEKHIGSGWDKEAT